MKNIGRNTLIIVAILTIITAIVNNKTANNLEYANNLLTIRTANAQAKSQMEIANYNYNWSYLQNDSLVAGTSSATKVFATGKNYNIMLMPIGGEVQIKFSANRVRWPHWFRIPNGQSVSFSGGKLDTLFYKSPTGTPVLQVIESVF